MRLKVAASVAFLTAGCGIDSSGTSSLPSESFQDGAVDATRFDGALPNATTDASLDTLPPLGEGSTQDSPDGARNAVDASDASCSPSPEDCTDGLDNNCNGLVDCEDPSCAAQGFACIDAVPNGFTFAPTALGSQPSSCGAGYGMQANLTADPNMSDAICGCSCSVASPPSCLNGTLSANWGTSMQGCTAGPVVQSAGGGACTTLNVPVVSNSSEQVTPAPVSGGSCQANPTSTLPSTRARPASRCAGLGRFGGGCANGGACAPVVQAPFSACVSAPGVTTCPTASYTVKHRAGTSLDDTRGCSGCTCGTPEGTCTNATATLYPRATCSGGGQSVTLNVDGQCNPVQGPGGGPTTYTAFQYSAQLVNPMCAAPAQPTPKGSATLVNEETICCRP